MEAGKPSMQGDDLELIGKTINGYQVMEQIGKGGMAYVYKAHQPSLDRYVALKVLPPFYAQQDQTFMARFEREAKAIAKLRHPNILLVMDYGEADSIAYIAMEYVEAGTLKERMERPMKLSEIITILDQVGSALDYAHSKGVIHRDIKPSNIMMPEDNWALLTDFGLARMVTGEQSNLTQSGMAVGTPTYMSPEQGKGMDTDHRSDIYSLGVILYEMVIGEAPYTAETPMAVVVKHITEPLPVISNRQDIPEEIQRIILKALAKDPVDRYQSAGDLVAALKMVLAARGDWHPTSSARQTNPAQTKVLPDPDGKTAFSGKGKEGSGFTWPILGGIAGGLAALAVILVGTLAIGYFGLNYINQRNERLAAAAASETAAALATLATKTPLPPPTQAPTEAPPPLTPLPPSGTVLFNDDFSDEESGWGSFGDRDTYKDYIDGEYLIRIIDTQYVDWANPGLEFGDVQIEVDAYLVEGPVENGYGLLCAYENSDNFINATISSDGYYEIWEFSFGEWEKLSEEQSANTNIIRGAIGEVNHIRLDCIGNNIILFVNDVELTSVQLDRKLRPGDVGIYAEGFEEGPLEIRFDNFVVTQP